MIGRMRGTSKGLTRCVFHYKGVGGDNDIEGNICAVMADKHDNLGSTPQFTRAYLIVAKPEDPQHYEELLGKDQPENQKIVIGEGEVLVRIPESVLVEMVSHLISSRERERVIRGAEMPIPFALGGHYGPQPKRVD